MGPVTAGRSAVITDAMGCALNNYRLSGVRQEGLAREEGVAPETLENSPRVRVPPGRLGRLPEKRVLRGRRKHTGDRDHEA